jgi:flagellin
MASNDLSRINTNIQAMNALNALNNVNSKLGVHQLRLATGKRINSAADDAAGFTIASKLDVKAKGLGTALDNIGSAKNLMTVAEGHLNNIKDILTEMKSKAQQAANGTLGTEERDAILNELTQFNSQIDAEVAQAKWADTSLLSGTAVSFQIGVGTSDNDALSFDVVGDTSASGFTSSDLSVDATATATITGETAIATSDLGATTFSAGTAQSTIGEAATGHYTVVVDYTVATATDGTVGLAIQVLDSDGNAIAVDDDGVGTWTSSTTLATTALAADAVGEIDFGNGIKIDLGAFGATSTSGTHVFSLDYSQGNSVDSQSNAQNFMAQIDGAIDQVTEGLGYIGSMVNRLGFQEESLTVAKTNTEAAYSRIVDADMAWEQLESTKMMILQQTATAMLSQANMAPQSILSLFG